MKIWLDDERNPQDKFWQQEKSADGDEVWVKTVPEAIKLLETGEVKSISFDHDLGTRETGYDLAKWIEAAAHGGKLPPLKWRVHSDNIPGLLKIVAAMKNADKFWGVSYP
jgi:hypothetical protein